MAKLRDTHFVLMSFGVALLALGGCGRGLGGDNAATGELAIEQERTYRETKQGKFLSLADFEQRGLTTGRQQVQPFSVFPPQDEALGYTAARSRTGSGALAVTLQPKHSLVYTLPGGIDLRKFTLLTMAIYSETLRDDLQMTLMSEAGNWTSVRTLLRPGWNHVRFDIQRLARQDDFDIGSVSGMRLMFADSASPVNFTLDDLLLVDNRAIITPTPPEVELRRVGLDYHVRLPGRDGIIKLVQSDDGLWRLGVHQATLKFAAPDQPLPIGGASLELLGEHRVGDIELLEHNAGRVRLAATWYFPARAGEWVSQGVRHIRWEYTIYADGRWVTYMLLNNAGGEPIGTVSISLLGRKAAWTGDGVARYLLVENFVGPVAPWSWLLAPTGADEQQLRHDYLNSARIEATLAQADVFAPGDVDKDHFDESQGCYFLAAEREHCRFRVIPPEGGLLRGVFRVGGIGQSDGEWGESVSINVDGEAIREFSRCDDGAVLFVLPGLLTRPANVEVRGQAGEAGRE